MIMHVITNYMANAGAETMLSRLARASPEAVLIVSLIDISDRNRLLAGEHARVERLSMHSGVGRGVGSFSSGKTDLPAKNRAVIVCWMYHAFLAGLLAQRLSSHSTPLFWNVRQSLDDPAALSLQHTHCATYLQTPFPFADGHNLQLLAIVGTASPSRIPKQQCRGDPQRFRQRRGAAVVR